MNTKKYIDIRIVGHQAELTEFLKICKFIQTFGTYGTSRTVKVIVDGDGSGHLRFSMLEKSEEIDIPSFKKEEIEGGKEFKVFIGE